MSAPIRLPGLRESGTSHALVLYETADAEECDGARTLRLVEHAVESMQELRARADHISAQSLDLIRLTQRERHQMRAALERACEEAAIFQQQASEAKRALTEATLFIREAEIGRREAELAAQDACARAEEAEARMQGMEFYLKKISRFLETRLVSLASGQ